jgi:hypothetical protein
MRSPSDCSQPAGQERAVLQGKPNVFAAVRRRESQAFSARRGVAAVNQLAGSIEAIVQPAPSNLTASPGPRSSSAWAASEPLETIPFSGAAS